MLKTIIIAILALLTGLLPIPLFSQHGLTGVYYDGADFNRQVFTRTDNKIFFVWDNVAPAPGINPEQFSIRWKGKIHAPESGTYHFRSVVDDGIRVKINGRLVIDAWGLNDSKRFIGNIDLVKDRLYELEVEYFNGMREGEIQLYWTRPNSGREQVVSSEFFYSPHATQPDIKSTPKPPVQPKPTPKPAPPTKPKPDPKPVTPIRDSIERYTPRNVQFDRGTSVMLAGSLTQLDQLAGFMVRQKHLRLRVEGHTDRVGDVAKNQALSEERVSVVAAYLVKKGVAADRITTKGFGGSKPLYTDIKGEDPRNRRVEFYIY